MIREKHNMWNVSGIKNPIKDINVEVGLNILLSIWDIIYFPDAKMI